MIIFILIPFLCYLFCQPGEFTFSVLYAKPGTSLIIKKTRINVLFTFFQNIINTPNYCKFQDKMNSTGKNLKATGRRRCCLELQKLVMAKTYLLIYLCHQNSWCTSNLQTDRSSWSHIIPKTAPLKLYRYSVFSLQYGELNLKEGMLSLTQISFTIREFLFQGWSRLKLCWIIPIPTPVSDICTVVA